MIVRAGGENKLAKDDCVVHFANPPISLILLINSLETSCDPRLVLRLNGFVEQKQ